MKVSETVTLVTGSEHTAILENVLNARYIYIQERLEEFAAKIAEEASTLLDTQGIIVTSVRVRMASHYEPALDEPKTVYGFTVLAEGEPYVPPGNRLQ